MVNTRLTHPGFQNHPRFWVSVHDARTRQTAIVSRICTPRIMCAFSTSLTTTVFSQGPGKVHLFKADSLIWPSKPPLEAAFGGDVGDTVYTERAQDCVPAVAMKRAAPGARAWRSSCSRSVSQNPWVASVAAQCPTVRAEQVRRRAPRSAGLAVGEDADGLAAGDGLPLLVLEEVVSRSNHGHLWCPGISGLRGRVRPGWCGLDTAADPPRRSPPQQMLPPIWSRAW